MADLGDATVNGSDVPRNPSDLPKKAETDITATVDVTLECPKDGLLSVGLVELLDIDDRPVFILDLASTSKTIPIYCNPRLREVPLLELKIGKGVISGGKSERDPKCAAFIEWAAATTRLGSFTETNCYGLRWKAKTIRKRWRVVSGEEDDYAGDAAVHRHQSEYPRPGRSQTMDRVERRDWSKPAITSNDSLEAQLSAFRLRREEEIQVFPSLAPRAQPAQRQDSMKHPEDIGRIDFTKPNPSFTLSSHYEFVLNFDWGSTELGPINQWSAELRRMANILMSDPRPAAMYYGKHRTMLYNEPYVVVMGQKHPGMMGKTFSDAWAEVEGDFSPAFDAAYETGTSYLLDDARFYIDRQGYLEETYYSISIIPFSVGDGDIGFYNPVSDSTRQVIADRRMAFFLRLGQYIASSREPKDFWHQLLLALQGDHLDLPFAILYSAGGDINETFSESSELSQNLRNWTLEGLVRVPESCTSIPKRINNELGMEEFLPNFYDLVKQDSPTLLRADDGTLPQFISRDITVIMDGKHPCKSAIFLPIRSTSDNVLGFMILGVNPRRQFDADYKVFVELLSRQLATSMVSALLFEEEIRRGQIAAEQATHDRNLLSKKLAVQTHEALEAETRFRRMADLAPVGMFHIDPQGVLLYGNNDYYKMTGHPRNVSYPLSWYNVLHDSDHPIMDREWAKLLGGETVVFELRLKRPFVAEEIVPGEKVEGFSWIIAAAYPERADDGTVIGILGCITDISRQKWMEGFQTRKMMEAVELKRQQENFIDMTSHEMRNPLSAIIQCGDWIGTSLSEFGGESQNVTIPRELVDGYVDAAQTIVLCAQHQKRIIDDILTLSKLDSDLLFVTPVEVQPISVIRIALKMFDSELQKSDVELRFYVDPSYSNLAVDWVRLDPSRFLQVLINLTTNAIKFTQTETKRKISISIGASIEPPPGRNGIEYLPRSSNRKDLTLGTAWGTGEMVYLYVEVEDTGRGLDEDERNLLFRRFSQASPRTHVQYGGSGLGLFISRELTELQGGQIGVASKAGVGSTFAFYLRARRCNPPEDRSRMTSQSVDMRAQYKIISPVALARLQTGSTLPTPREKATQPVAPKHVLIVEDNIVNQKVLSKQLRSAGCTVHVANHGGEALSFLSKTRFWAGNENSGLLLHIILMDLEMPVMNGLTCVKRIRELQKEGVITRHVPVIAVTANARSEQIATAKESGMDSVVTKPFRIPELLPEMERQVRRGEGRPVELERSSFAPD